MNSIIEVSPNIIALVGSDGVSEFRLKQLRQTIDTAEIKNIRCHEIYFCQLHGNLSKISEEEISKLSNLLNANDNTNIFSESFFFITPRIGTISPWSSKATDIAKNCGLNGVARIERGLCYSVDKKVDTKIIADRMKKDKQWFGPSWAKALLKKALILEPNLKPTLGALALVNKLIAEGK